MSLAPPSFDGKKKIDEQNEISVPTVQAFMSSVVKTVLCYRGVVPGGAGGARAPPDFGT